MSIVKISVFNTNGHFCVNYFNKIIIELVDQEEFGLYYTQWS